MRNIKWLLLILFLLIPIVNVQAATAPNPIELYIFTRQGCSHCAAALSLLNTLKTTSYPNLNYYDFDMANDRTAIDKFFQFASAYNVSADSVPGIFIGTTAIIGYEESNIRDAISRCSDVACQNPQDIVNNYLIDHPSAGNSTGTTTNTKQIVGWSILGVAIIASAVIFTIKK
ncbi:MAG: hypothetical protein V1763_02070 [Parcubacteria group bacterium]